MLDTNTGSVASGVFLSHMLHHVGICISQETVPVVCVPCMSRIILVFVEGLRESAETGRDLSDYGAKPGGCHQDIAGTSGETACTTGESLFPHDSQDRAWLIQALPVFP